MSWRSALPRIGIDLASPLAPLELAALLVSAGERVAALEAYRELSVASPDDLDLLGHLAALLARLGRDDECDAIRKRIAEGTALAMGLAPEHRDAAVAFELALVGLGPTPAEMPEGYTVALFDAYAPSFDRSLLALRYKAPELLFAALASALEGRAPLVPPAASLVICDVGCGTGLCGPLLRPLAVRLDGVDRSTRMLERAQALGVYDELVAGDLTAFLGGRAARYDVVTAADVLVYMGDLGPALSAASRSLRPSGLLVFSLQRSEADDEKGALTASGRYEHGTGAVRGALATAGLVEISVTLVTLREEQSRPVRGVIWVVQKAEA